MRIQHNLSAMNSLSNYNSNNKALSNNLEKLSSGYRINSAADDAAGLAISEKMRSQIAGLEKATDNANDGISLVQTGEGALTEVNSMLTRLTELATQSASGTYDDTTDRANIQEETNAILSEVDRISQSTNYNGINLLDGSLSGKSQVSNLAIGTSTAVKGKYTAAAAFADTGDLSSLKADDIGKSLNYTVTWEDSTGSSKTTTVSLTYQGKGDGTSSGTATDNYFTDGQGNKYNLAVGGKLTAANLTSAFKVGLQGNEEFNSNFAVTDDTQTLSFTANTAGKAGAAVVSTGMSTSLSVNPGGKGDGTAAVATAPVNAMQNFDVTTIALANNTDKAADLASKTFEIDGHKFLAAVSDFSESQRSAIGNDVTIINTTQTDAAATADTGKAVTGDAARIAADVSRVTGFKTAVDGTTTSQINFTEDTLKLSGTELKLQVGDTNASYQHVSVQIADMSSAGLGISGLDLSTQDSAGNAIATIKAAVNKVSTQRGKLGALQNRLDHTINNLGATDENITAAESQIRDVDMAREMTQYSKNNILVQASQSMLAQANSTPQGILSLLQ